MNKQEIMNLKPGKELDMLVSKMVFELSSSNNGQFNCNYSTDPREIWRIVEYVTKKDFIYTLSNSENKHVCAFDNLGTHRRFIAHANTLIEAVCKAAVLAMDDFNRETV